MAIGGAVIADLCYPLISRVLRQLSGRRQTAVLSIAGRRAPETGRFSHDIEAAVHRQLEARCTRHYGLSYANLDGGDRASFRARHLNAVLRGPSVQALVEQRLVVLCHERVLEGDEEVIATLGRLWRGRPRRRYGWLTMGLLSKVSGGRFGWSPLQAQRSVEERISNYDQLRALILENPASWGVLMERVKAQPALAPGEGEDGEGGPTPLPSTPPSRSEEPAPLPPPQSTFEERSSDLPSEPRRASSLAVDETADEAPAARDHEDLEAISRQIGDADCEFYTDPERGLNEAAELLEIIARREPGLEGVVALHARISSLRERLQGYADFWKRETGDEQAGDFCPLTQRVLEQVTDVPDEQYVAALRRRLCFAYLHCDDPSLLERPAPDANGEGDSSPRAGADKPVAATQIAAEPTSESKTKAAEEADRLPDNPYRDAASEYGL